MQIVTQQEPQKLIKNLLKRFDFENTKFLVKIRDQN